VIAVFRATGIRLSELTGIRANPGDPGRSDIGLWNPEITVTGKGRKTRVVKITHDAARALDRYLRARARHPQAQRPSCGSGTAAEAP
jgi:site-specific recombinase XerC